MINKTLVTSHNSPSIGKFMFEAKILNLSGIQYRKCISIAAFQFVLKKWAITMDDINTIV